MSAGISRLGTMGWLLLSASPPGSGERFPRLGEKILEITDLSRTQVCMTIGEIPDTSFIHLIDDLETILGGSIQVIDLQSLIVEELRELWLTSSLKILGGGSIEGWYKFLGTDLFQVQPEEVLPDASVLLAIGAAAGAMGSWAFNDESATLMDALGWVVNGIVLPGWGAPSQIDSVRDHVSDHLKSYAIGLPEHALLALGPENQVEVWSETPPTVFLGMRHINQADDNPHSA